MADIPKGEQNRNPTEKHYSILCPSYGLGDRTKTFYLANNWWDLRHLYSDGSSNKVSMHWDNHFKGLYDTNKIPHLVLKMADNHLCILYSQYLLQNGGNYYPYFNYDENNRRSDWIKSDASVRKERHARQLKEINSDTKARRDVGNKLEPEMRVFRLTI